MRNVLFLAFISLMTLSACGGDVRDTLGIGRNVPDEFTVMTRAPLSLPPDYNLRPPVPGAARPQEKTTSQTAAKLVLGAGAATTKATPGNAEQALLQQAGADQATADIRATVDREAPPRAKPDADVLDKLQALSDKKTKDPVVDAAAESKRVREAQKTGANPAAGKVVQTDPSSKSTWDKISAWLE